MTRALSTLFTFAAAIKAAKANALIVHARKAWLKGLSPRENREVPPLDYALVHRLKATHPDLEIILNGGLASIEQARTEVIGLDGVMMGRAAYQEPWRLLRVDPVFFDAPASFDSAQRRARWRSHLISNVNSQKERGSIPSRAMCSDFSMAYRERVRLGDISRPKRRSREVDRRYSSTP